MRSLIDAIRDGEAMGWTRREAAERILQGAKRESRGRIRGLWRMTGQFFPSMEQNKAHFRTTGTYLPDPKWTIIRNDTEMSPIPSDIFAEVSGVDAELKSHWQDDDKKPSEWIEIDWEAGTVDAYYSGLFGCPFELDGDPPDVLKLRVSAVQIAPALAAELMMWTDDEVAALILAWPGTGMTNHWNAIKADPRCPKQARHRDLWRRYRNAQRGRPPKAQKRIV